MLSEFWTLSSAPLVNYLTGLRYPMLPRLRGNLLLGHLYTFKNEGLFTLILQADKTAREYGHSICYFWLSPTTCALLVTQPQHIKQILMASELSRTIPLKALGQLFGEESIFLDKGKSATEKRKILKEKVYHLPQELFKNNTLTGFMKLYINSVLNEIAESNQSIRLRYLTNKIALNVFVQTQLGLQKELSEHFITVLSEAIQKAFQAAVDGRQIFPDCMKKILSIPKLDEVKEEMKNVFLENFLIPNEKDIFSTDNIITKIIENFQHENIDIEKIYSQACILLIAGHETTSNALQFTLILLSRYKEIAEELKNELRNKINENGELNLSELSYLRCIIRESLRLYPPAAISARGVDEDFAFKISEDQNIILRKGDIVFISPYLTHRLPEYYTQPETFTPSRYRDLGDKVNIGPKYGDFSYLPFSNGNRNCPAWPFVEREIMITLILLYATYDVKLANDEVTDQSHPHDIAFEFSGTIKPLSEIQLTLRKSEDSIPIKSIQVEKNKQIIHNQKHSLFKDTQLPDTLGESTPSGVAAPVS